MGDCRYRVIGPDMEWLDAFNEMRFSCGAELPDVFTPEVPEGLTIVDVLSGHSKGEYLPQGFVPASHFWLVDESTGQVIGAGNLRHELNDFLRFRGGHIGYFIRPEKRRQGGAVFLLNSILETCRKMGLEEVLVTCDDTNAGSFRTIEKCGGILKEKDTDGVGVLFRRYVIIL